VVASVDVSGWEPAGEEQLGTKPKQWLRDEAGRLWLWKEATFNTDQDGRPYRKGDDWSEFAAGRLGRCLGVAVAIVELATRGDTAGVISRKVLAEEEALIHGNELLAGPTTDDPHDRTGYTLEAVRAVLDGVGPPAQRDGMTTAFDWFAGYLVLDCLVGNTDRHQDNWAVIRGPAGRRLAPSFDHASCLGFLLSDQRRGSHLTTADRNRTVAAYARRAASKFAGRPSLVRAAVDALAMASTGARQRWIAAVESAPELSGILVNVPEDRMGETAKRFAASLYRENRELLSQAVSRMAP